MYEVCNCQTRNKAIRLREHIRYAQTPTGPGIPVIDILLEDSIVVVAPLFFRLPSALGHVCKHPRQRYLLLSDLSDCCYLTFLESCSVGKAYCPSHDRSDAVIVYFSYSHAHRTRRTQHCIENCGEAHKTTSISDIDACRKPWMTTGYPSPCAETEGAV